MYGTQATNPVTSGGTEFENDVKMYGTQAYIFVLSMLSQFENDVKMYGTQAAHLRFLSLMRLRMM